MNNSLEKTERLKVTASIITVIAHVILVVGIIAVFSWPLFGLAVGFVAAILYIFLVAIAQVFRKMATPDIAVLGVDPEVLRRRKIFRTVRYVILASLGALIIIAYAKSALN